MKTENRRRPIRTLLRKILVSKEIRVIFLLLLREAMLLSLLSLALLLSLESLLPGTVSLRESMIFFILGISCMILAERHFSHFHGVPPQADASPKKSTSRRMRMLFIGFVLWAIFLLGNALFGFHLATVSIVLIMTIPILSLFFDMTFNSRAR